MTTTTQFIADPDRDQTIIAHTERFDGLLDHNAELRATQQFGDKEMRHVANIPGIIIEAYCFQTGVSWSEFWSDQKHMKVILNDPQFSLFRIHPGRV